MQKLLYETILQFTPKNEINGAGPKRWGNLVRDNIFGLSVTPAADIHDGMYYFLRERKKSYDFARIYAFSRPGGLLVKSEAKARAFADKVFFKNMEILNSNKMTEGLWKYIARKPIIWGYYLAVRAFGAKFIR